jgi:hypothetical protein
MSMDQNRIDALGALIAQSATTTPTTQREADERKLLGFVIDDLSAIADGLEAGYEKSIDVGGSPLDGNGPNLIASTTAIAARFIRAAIDQSTRQAAPMTYEEFFAEAKRLGCKLPPMDVAATDQPSAGQVDSVASLKAQVRFYQRLWEQARASLTPTAPQAASRQAGTSAPRIYATSNIEGIADELEAEAMNYEGDFADTVKGCVEALRELAPQAASRQAEPIARVTRVFGAARAEIMGYREGALSVNMPLFAPQAAATALDRYMESSIALDAATDNLYGQAATTAGAPCDCCKDIRAAEAMYGDGPEAAPVQAAQPALPADDLYIAYSDDAAVELFAKAMKEKMAASRAKGRNGWHDPEQCPAERLQTMLVEHLAKGDPVDVGNFAMMLWNRGVPTAAPGAAQTTDAREGGV